ncbi:hypothetical protein NEAUS04_1013 [Nematocida ausubeli]|nr:hypothetical protein NEAUS07_1193 [Nematocida ausubeli]KAI5162308.1 hypothetical protein NEAUS04_1013 [Nematocida ausubeli]
MLFPEINILVNKAKHASAIYKQASAAQAAALQVFSESTVFSNTAYSADPLMISILKHCNLHLLTLKSMHKMACTVSRELEAAVKIAENYVAKTSEDMKNTENKLDNKMKSIYTAAEIRKSAFSTEKYDIWKAEIELKEAIFSYIKEETSFHSLKKATINKSREVYNELLKSYYKSLQDFTSSSEAISNNFLNEVSQDPFLKPALLPDEFLEISAEKTNAQDVLKGSIPQNIGEKQSLTQDEQTRYNELHTQIMHSTYNHRSNFAPAVHSCGLFLVPKVSQDEILFIICTNTNYLHGFSFYSKLEELSHLLPEEKEGFVPSLRHALINFNEKQIEKIHAYLLNSIGCLKTVSKVFPISLKNKTVYLQGDKEIVIKEESFFPRIIKIQAFHSQQIQKFSWFLSDPSINAERTTEEAPIEQEQETAWSPIPYDNPW